jgi:predicted phosphoribosyltransferase
VSPYLDRGQAGDALGRLLIKYADQPDVIVLGLVRGGVPVAARVAAALGTPLDVLVVRKLGVPWAPEVAFGAVGSAGVRVFNAELARQVDEVDRAAVVATETAELTRRESVYRPGRAPLDLTGRTAIIVDDGLATGATATAALAVAGRLGAARTVLAVPVGADDAVDRLRRLADELLCPLVPADFGAVSRYYQHFGQVTDDQVTALLTNSG